MSIGLRLWPALALALAVLAGPVAAQGEATAGRFIAVTGDVQIVGTNGVARKAVRDGEFRQGETIVTGANSLAQLRMTDGGALSLRAESQLVLERYRFAGIEDREASLFISIVKGGLRTISGLIGRTRHDAYRVTTPSVTVGIRGTHFEVVHVVQPLPDAPAGSYGRVYDGTIALTNKAGISILVGRDQTAFVALPGNLAPVLRSAPAGIFGRPTPVPLPAVQPRADDGKAEGGTPSAAHKDGTRAVAPGALREVAPATTVAPSRTLSTPLLNPIDTPRVMEVAPATTTLSPATTTISPTLISPTTTISPATTTTTSPTTTTISPATTTIAPTTTTISPTTTTISPTLISPTTTTIAPTTTTISPTTTTISPTLISPTTTTIAPTTTTIAPTTTTIAPTTTTIQTSPTLTSPTLTAPTTTIKR